MAEKLIRSADASCYSMQDGSWVCLDGGLSTIWLFKANDSSSARIVAKSTSDQRYVINSALGPGCTCSMVSANFVQWASSGSVWGLNFADAENASYFGKRVTQVIDAVMEQLNKAPSAGPEIPEAPAAPAPEALPVAEAPSVAKEALKPAPATPASKAPSFSRSSLKHVPVAELAAAAAAPAAETLATETVATKRASFHAAEGSAPKPPSKRGSIAEESGSSRASPASLPVSVTSTPSSLPPPISDDVARTAALDASSSSSPKLTRPGRFSTVVSGPSSRPGSGTINRKNTDPGMPGKNVVSQSSGLNSPSTMRFSGSKKKNAWRDAVDMTTPRSMVIQNVDEMAPEANSLIQKDVASLSTRERVIKELFTTELSYCKSLQSVVKTAIPLTTVHKPFKPEQQAQIFGNIEFVYAVNATFLGKLHTKLSDWDDNTSCVGDVMLGAIRFFKPYALYLAEYSSALKLLEELEIKKKSVQTYTAACQEECGGLTLTSLLITPVQRIPRYILLLQEVIKFTPETHPDRKNLTDALAAVKKYADDMNKTVKLSENKKEFTRLANIIEGLSVIKSPLLWSDEKVRIQADGESFTWMILFSDRMVFIRDNKCAQEVLLHTIWVRNITSKGNDLVFQMTTPDRKYMVESEIPQNKHQWLDRLEAAIAADLTERDYVDSEQARRFAFKWTQGNNLVSIYQGQWKDALPQGNGKFKYASKASYEGAFEKGKRHGQGKMLYPTGDAFDGSWEDDLPHGKGKLVSPVLEYEGDFVKGEFCGQGSLSHADGSTYSGSFLHGLYHGQGELKDVGGAVYKGEWKDGLRHGGGTLTSVVGVYEGTWKNDRQEGEFCSMTYASGISYKGAFVDGVPSGSGKMTFPSGSVYTGFFLNGNYDGVGLLEERGGKRTYQGQFFEGRRHGKGLQKFEDGSMYEGEYQMGRRHGQGKWSSTTILFEGNWELDVFHGRGKLTEAVSGRVLFEGQWKYGRREGKGYATYADGTKYTGGFVGDLRDGIGVMENATVGWKFGGDWSKGRRHGNGEFVTPNYKYAGEWVQDRRTGQGKERFSESHTSFEGEFLNDRRVRGKASVEAPGKMPHHVEIDYEKEKKDEYILKLPPPVAGVQIALFDLDVTIELDK